MLGKQHGFLKGKQQAILIASTVIALLTAFLLFYEPPSPDGTYYWPELACGHGVWIFKDGKIYDQCVGDEDPKEIGAYIKSGNKWIGFSKNGTVIRPSIFGITLYESSLKNGRKFFWRDQLSWVIGCKDWIRQHF